MKSSYWIAGFVLAIVVGVGVYVIPGFLTGDTPVTTQTSEVVPTPDSEPTAHVSHNHTSDQVTDDLASADKMEVALIPWERPGCKKTDREGPDGELEMSTETCDFTKTTPYSELSDEELNVAVANYDGAAVMELAMRLQHTDPEGATELFLKSAAYADSIAPLGRYISMRSQSNGDDLEEVYVMARVMEYGGVDKSYADSIKRRLQNKYSLTSGELKELDAEVDVRLNQISKFRAESVGGEITLRNSMEGEKS